MAKKIVFQSGMKIGVLEDEAKIIQTDEDAAGGAVGLVKCKDGCVTNGIDEEDGGDEEIRQEEQVGGRARPELPSAAAGITERSVAGREGVLSSRRQWSLHAS